MKRLIVLLTVAAVAAAIPMTSASARPRKPAQTQKEKKRVRAIPVASASVRTHKKKTKEVRAIRAKIRQHRNQIDALVEKMSEVASRRSVRNHRRVQKRLIAKIKKHTRAIVSLEKDLAAAIRRAERRARLEARKNKLPARFRHGYGNVSRKEMASLLHMLRTAFFDNERLDLVKDMVTSGHRLSAKQAASVLKAFDFDRNRVEAAQMLCNAVNEPALHVLVTEIDFKSNRRTLRKRTGGQCGVPQGRLAMRW